jgi:hypothetical protein
MGDVRNVILSACGFNIRKLLISREPARYELRESLRFFIRAFLYPDLRSVSEAFSWIKESVK